MVHAVQKGEMKAPSPEIAAAAKSMSKQDAKDFASTRHEGLPSHVKKALSELAKGVEEEKEHGFNKVLRTQVAKDHLKDNKKYYTILEKCMDKHEKTANCAEHDKNIPASFDARQKPFTGKPKGKTPNEKKAFTLGFIKAARAVGLSDGMAVDLLGKTAKIDGDQLGQMFAQPLVHAGIGGGIGAGIGGVSGYLAGQNKEHPEADHSIRDALLGILAGGAGGAAIGGGAELSSQLAKNPELTNAIISGGLQGLLGSDSPTGGGSTF